MSRTRQRWWRGLLVGAATLAVAGAAAARPLYFDTFTALYGLTPGDDLYACGVCHRNWDGTGARNPYGIDVEQQLYVSKPITDAILAVEAGDSDGDGFSNVDEITVHGTLPAYSCANFSLAFNVPGNFQALITPAVASCLEPKDLLVTPGGVSFVTEVGLSDVRTVELVNFGQDDPITVSDIALLPGADPSLSLDVPSLPLVIPVGDRATVDIAFAPTASLPLLATLRITSDDPDEPMIDVGVTALGIVVPRAPAPARAACLGVIDTQYRKFTKTHLKEWTRCLGDEVRGRACDAGRRDLKLAAAEEKLRSYVGGSRDKRCAGAGLSPSLAGLPTTCPAPCDAIPVTNIGGLADCLVCVQEASTDTLLAATYGTLPPDLPAAAPLLAASCQKGLATAMSKGVQKAQKALAACMLANITAVTPVDCAAAHAGALTAIDLAIAKAAARCKDDTGLQSCLHQPSPDPACLADAAENAVRALIQVSFGAEP